MFIRPITIMANLFYIIGASGSGKDSLIRYARNHIAADALVVFTHRYITRPAEAGGENHIALDEKEFFARKDMGCFAMSWYTNATYYGIGIEINQWLAKGLSVVVNGPHAYLQQAAQQYHELRPVLISVELDNLRQRLEQRGRENKDEIERRLQQAQKLELDLPRSGLIKIENNGLLKEAGKQLIQIITSHQNHKCA